VIRSDVSLCSRVSVLYWAFSISISDIASSSPIPVKEAFEDLDFTMVASESVLKSRTRDCRSSKDLDFLRSLDCWGGTSVSCGLPLVCVSSSEKDRDVLVTIGAVAVVGVGPLIVMIEDDVEVWLTELFARCEGILDRRGTRGDFRAVSTSTSLSRGLVFGLDELSEISSIYLVASSSRTLDDCPCSCNHCSGCSGSAKAVLATGISGSCWVIVGRGLLGRPGLLKGGVSFVAAVR
jgi:hypothetical protein